MSSDEENHFGNDVETPEYNSQNEEVPNVENGDKLDDLSAQLDVKFDGSNSHILEHSSTR